MRDKAVYDTESFEAEMSRYVTPSAEITLLVNNPSKRTLEESSGPRYASALSATTEEKIVTVDIFPGPHERKREYMRNPQQYWNKEPFKTEVDCLRGMGLDPTPDPSKFEFYLKGDETRPEFRRFEPDEYRNYFDRCFAPELLLHPPQPSDPNENLAISIFQEAYVTLAGGGKFMFPVYPPSHAVKDPGCLDKYFGTLAKARRIPTAIDGSWIDIGSLSSMVDEQTYAGNKEFFDRFWLRDLSRIRLYAPEEIEGLAKDRFRIITMENIPGGMFPFAARHFYVLEKV